MVRTRKITVPWLRLQASSAGGKVGSLVRELRFPHDPWLSKKKEKKKAEEERKEKLLPHTY